ncbi:hypothetical protein ABZZ20_33840 [Streptomyces sp. NPDC006430]
MDGEVEGRRQLGPGDRNRARGPLRNRRLLRRRRRLVLLLR